MREGVQAIEDTYVDYVCFEKCDPSCAEVACFGPGYDMCLACPEHVEAHHWGSYEDEFGVIVELHYCQGCESGFTPHADTPEKCVPCDFVDHSDYPDYKVSDACGLCKFDPIEVGTPREHYGVDCAFDVEFPCASVDEYGNCEFCDTFLVDDPEEPASLIDLIESEWDYTSYSYICTIKDGFYQTTDGDEDTIK
jgi:hypothetical protein